MMAYYFMSRLENSYNKPFRALHVIFFYYIERRWVDYIRLVSLWLLLERDPRCSLPEDFNVVQPVEFSVDRYIFFDTKGSWSAFLFILLNGFLRLFRIPCLFDLLWLPVSLNTAPVSYSKPPRANVKSPISISSLSSRSTLLRVMMDLWSVDDEGIWRCGLAADVYKKEIWDSNKYPA